ncbi:MAG: hypothetical protein VW268_05240 [Rhodospirillaceae bacterium]
MFQPISLNKTVGEDYDMDLGDALNTKVAMTGPGQMTLPDHSLTEFPDRPMIDGVRNFQSAHGLAVDGVMKTDGPTIGQVNKVLAQNSISAPKNPRRQSKPLENQDANNRFREKFHPPNGRPR